MSRETEKIVMPQQSHSPCVRCLVCSKEQSQPSAIRRISKNPKLQELLKKYLQIHVQNGHCCRNCMKKLQTLHMKHTQMKSLCHSTVRTLGAQPHAASADSLSSSSAHSKSKQTVSPRPSPSAQPKAPCSSQTDTASEHISGQRKLLPRLKPKPPPIKQINYVIKMPSTQISQPLSAGSGDNRVQDRKLTPASKRKNSSASKTVTSSSQFQQQSPMVNASGSRDNTTTISLNLPRVSFKKDKGPAPKVRIVQQELPCFDKSTSVHKQGPLKDHGYSSGQLVSSSTEWNPIVSLVQSKTEIQVEDKKDVMKTEERRPDLSVDTASQNDAALIKTEDDRKGASIKQEEIVDSKPASVTASEIDIEVQVIEVSGDYNTHVAKQEEDRPISEMFEVERTDIDTIVRNTDAANVQQTNVKRITNIANPADSIEVSNSGISPVSVYANMATSCYNTGNQSVMSHIQAPTVSKTHRISSVGSSASTYTSVPMETSYISSVTSATLPSSAPSHGYSQTLRSHSSFSNTSAPKPSFTKPTAPVRVIKPIQTGDTLFFRSVNKFPNVQEKMTMVGRELHTYAHAAGREEGELTDMDVKVLSTAVRSAQVQLISKEIMTIPALRDAVMIRAAAEIHRSASWNKSKAPDASVLLKKDLELATLEDSTLVRDFAYHHSLLFHMVLSAMLAPSVMGTRWRQEEIMAPLAAVYGIIMNANHSGKSLLQHLLTYKLYKVIGPTIARRKAMLNFLSTYNITLQYQTTLQYPQLRLPDVHAKHLRPSNSASPKQVEKSGGEEVEKVNKEAEEAKREEVAAAAEQLLTLDEMELEGVTDIIRVLPPSQS